jgi:threonine/homoserine/homoserine lactone efflux protein
LSEHDIFSDMLVSSVMLGGMYGFICGVSPGPFLAFLLTQSLVFGRRVGFWLALTPLLIDLPIALFCIYVLGESSPAFLPWLSFMGGGFAIYLGIDTLRTTRAIGTPWKHPNTLPKSQPFTLLQRAVLTNVLTPYPYLFWSTIGISSAASVGSHSPVAFATFVAGFYATLIGGKLLLVELSHRSKKWFRGDGYLWLIRICAILLIALGMRLLKIAFLGNG